MPTTKPPHSPPPFPWDRLLLSGAASALVAYLVLQACLALMKRHAEAVATGHASLLGCGGGSELEGMIRSGMCLLVEDLGLLSATAAATISSFVIAFAFFSVASTLGRRLWRHRD